MPSSASNSNLTDFVWQDAAPLVYLLIAIAPLLAFAVTIHLLERFITFRLSSRFGWNSVLWTGWLGTPVHELSHAVMCLVFRMPIEKIALFEPDRKSGCLGYVLYRHERGNWIHDIGTVFVATAPLVGGTVSILGLLMLFYPDVAHAALTNHSGESLMEAVQDAVQTLASGILQVDHLLTVKLWLFIYLVICIGSHMAPSFLDYRGALKGALVVGIGLILASLLVALLTPDGVVLLGWLQPVLVSLLTVMVITIALNLLAAAVVWALTAIYDRLGTAGSVT